MKDVQLKHEGITITLRRSLNDKFQKLVSDILGETNCHYFSHQLIKNYHQNNHYVSSFGTALDWQDKYWSDYWDKDPLEHGIHKIALSQGIVVSSWQVVDPSSDVMAARLKFCKVRDGFHFACKLKGGILENFSFGWDKFDTDNINFSKFLKLAELVRVFRQLHFELFSQPSRLDADEK